MLKNFKINAIGQKMTDKHNSNIWALNPKNLRGFISSQKEIVPKEYVQLISNHIARYIRSM